MKSIARVTIPALLALALAAGGAEAQQRTLRKQLVGTWTLVSQDSVGSDGTRKPTLGPQPRGTLMMDAHGRYAMILIDSTRPKWNSGIRTETTPEEYASAAKGLVAQFGTWSVDEESKVLTREVEGALGPNAPGKVGKWVVTLAGDDLKVSSAEGQVSSINGGTIEVAFRRAE
jgi:hypothetical protein